MFSKHFTKQDNMMTVLIALLPIYLFGIYSFGLRVLALLIFNSIVGLAVEYITEKAMYNRNKVSLATVVTAAIFTLTITPLIPFWQSAIGIAFAMFFGRQVFGGFGSNPYNPALVGRAFMFINFTGGMSNYIPSSLAEGSTAGVFGSLFKWVTPTVDGLSSASPFVSIKYRGAEFDNLTLFLGKHSGAIGEISILLILLGALYLLLRKAASWEIMISSIIGFFATSYIILAIGPGEGHVLEPILGLLIGGFMFATVFMATDPTSAPESTQAKWIYGLMFGAIAVIIRGYGNFIGGTMFALLITQTFAPIIDYVFLNRKKNKGLKKGMEA